MMYLKTTARNINRDRSALRFNLCFEKVHQDNLFLILIVHYAQRTF